jgi:hypothetical protein
MTSGTTSQTRRTKHRPVRALPPPANIRRWLQGTACFALGLLGLAPQTWAESPHDLYALMSELSGVTQVQAKYREVVESALLQQPLSSTGQLRYQAPDRIAKLDDRGTEVRIAGDAIDIVQGNKRSQYSVSDHESIQTFVLALRATFAGDLERLQTAYTLAFQVQPTGWMLELQPRERRLLPFFERIHIAGVDNRIDTIEILENNGDRRTMHLTGQQLITSDGRSQP